MHILLVRVKVKPEGIALFQEACRANAEATLKEPGAARYDVVQSVEDPTRFLLIEAYIDKATHLRHRDTAHCQHWRDAVNPLMDEPRTFETFTSIFPETERWFCEKH